MPSAVDFLTAPDTQEKPATALDFLNAPTDDELQALKKTGDAQALHLKQSAQANQPLQSYLEENPTQSTLEAQKLLPLATTPEKQELLAKYIRDTKAPELETPGVAGQALDAATQGPIPKGEVLLQASPKSVPGKIALGVERTGEDLGNFFLSPAGIATLGIGSLPRAAQRAIALGFSAQMASNVPGETAQLLQEVTKDPKDRDWTKIAQLVSGAAANTILAGVGAVHGFAPKTEAIAKGAAQQLDKTQPAGSNLSEPTPIVQQAEEQPAAPGVTAKEFLSSNENKTPPTQKETQNPTGVPATRLQLQPALLVNDKPVMGGATHKQIFEKVLADPNVPKDQKADTAEAMLNDAQHVFVDQNGKVYDRAAAAEAFDKANGKPPGTTKSLHSEMLSPATTPEAPETPEASPVLKTAQSVTTMSPDEFISFSRQAKGGLTGEAYRVGQSVKTPEELKSLLDQRQVFSDIGAKARVSKDFETGISAALRSQFFREAYEAATGTGSAGESLRKTNPEYKPPFPIQENETPEETGAVKPAQPAVVQPGVIASGESVRTEPILRQPSSPEGSSGSGTPARPVAATNPEPNPGLPGTSVQPPVEPNNGKPPSENPESGQSYGVAERVRDARAAAGQVVPVEPGVGIAPEASVERGRQLLKDGQSPDEALSAFEKTGKLSGDDMALVRARGEQLAKMASDAEQKHGTDSNEYALSWHLLSDWDARTKAMQTEWHKIGQAQQGETDIDTGTFTGLQRAYRESSGTDFTPEQSKKAKQIAEENTKAVSEVENARQNLVTTLDSETAKTSPPPKIEPVEPHVRLVADKLKSYFQDRATAAMARIKQRRSEGRLFTGIDPTELADYADYGASKILEKGLEVEKMTEDWAREMVSEIGDYIKPHLDAIWKASQKVFLDGFKKQVGIGETPAKVKKTLKADAQSTVAIPDAERNALDAAHKTVRNAASDVAKAENDSRVAQQELKNEQQDIQKKASGKAVKSASDVARRAASDTAKAENEERIKKATRKVEASDVQKKAAQRALDAANNRVRQAAADAAKAAEKARVKAAEIKSFGEPGSLDEIRKMLSYRKEGEAFTPEQVRAIWNYAKRNYLDKGVTNFDDIRNSLATDIGVSVKEITQALAAPKGAKRLTDELWKKQQQARRLQDQAKRWVHQTTMPGYLKALKSIPNILFGLKVGFHGTVALGTHAPMVAFQPQFWKTYFTDFLKMYKMVGSPSFYEREAQDLIRRPNYVAAKRAGLVNDPFKVEDFNNPDMSQFAGRLTGMGNRGYFVLKILRQDMFDQAWSNLPETAKVPEVAQAISDGINHATGVIKGSAPRGSSLALFAPRLAMSRVSWLAVDPVKGLMSAADWKNATPAEKVFAINQIKEKATVAATLFGLLALNQGILMALNSKQSINFNNPMKSDFLKFKGAGMTFSYGNAMLSMARLPVRLYQIRESDGGKLKNLIYPDEDTYNVLGEYARSQLSPFASLALDLWLKSDWQNRPLPNSPRPVPKRLAAQGVKPYTWPEFWSEQMLPIPLEEATREVWQSGFGMSSEQLAAIRKAMATIAVMAATGGRLVDDNPPPAKNKSVLSE